MWKGVPGLGQVSEAKQRSLLAGANAVSKKSIIMLVLTMYMP